MQFCVMAASVPMYLRYKTATFRARGSSLHSLPAPLKSYFTSELLLHILLQVFKENSLSFTYSLIWGNEGYLGLHVLAETHQSIFLSGLRPEIKHTARTAEPSENIMKTDY